MYRGGIIMVKNIWGNKMDLCSPLLDLIKNIKNNIEDFVESKEEE